MHVARRSKVLRFGSVYGRRNPAIRTSGFVAQLASEDYDRSVSVGLEFDVQFPRDYNELLDQVLLISPQLLDQVLSCDYCYSGKTIIFGIYLSRRFSIFKKLMGKCWGKIKKYKYTFFFQF